MQVKSIAECSRDILQYFWPALSYNWYRKSIIGLFESGRLDRFYCIIFKWTFSNFAEPNYLGSLYLARSNLF